METQIVFRNALFDNHGVMFLRKRGNIYINSNDVKRIVYTRPTLWNLLAIGLGAMACSYPQRMLIFLNKKIKGKALYYLQIKYKEFYKLPDWVKDCAEIE